MYCTNCRNEMDDKAVVCPNCGVPAKVENENDKGGFGWGALGFFIPLVGLILYLVWKGEKPKTAKAAGKGALISVILGIVIYALVFIISMAALSTSY